MMGTTLSVFLKEILDNVRDRRTLASALLMGPIFGPILFSFVINLSIERSIDRGERTLELPVIGREHAPHLIEFIRSKNIDLVQGPDDLDAAMEAVKLGTHDVVLVVPPDLATESLATATAGNAGRQVAPTNVKGNEANPHIIMACLPSLSRLRGQASTRWFAPSQCPDWHR